MNDLIWIGNMLIPRGVVIGVAFAVFAAPFVIGAVVSIIRDVRDWTRT